MTRNGCCGAAGRRLARYGAGILVILSCAACAVGPDYVRPAATPVMPAVYKELDGWKTAQPGAVSLRENWWELFGDPQLNRLEERVAAANQNVAAAEAQYRQARALAQASRAGYFPTLSVGPAISRAQRSANVGSGTFGGGSVNSDFTLPASLSWEIDLWGRIRRGVEASRAGAAASAADLAAVRLSMQAELASDYFQLRTLDAQRQLLDETVGNYAKTLELTRNRYASGVAASSDVLQAETQLKSTRAQALDLGVQRAQLEHAVAVLVGTPAAQFTLASVPLNGMPPVVPAGIPSQLLERRPDIAAAERRMAAANAQIGVTEAAWYPTLRLSASGGFESSDIASWFSWPSRFWSVGPAVSETIFDGGLRRAQDDQARAAFDATVAAYRQTVLTGFQEVEDNLAALRILATEAQVQDEAVQAARRAVTVTTNQYKAGTVDYLNVLVTQTAELTNRRTAVDILGRRMAASVALVKALGGGWQAAEATETPRTGAPGGRGHVE